MDAHFYRHSKRKLKTAKKEKKNSTKLFDGFTSVGDSDHIFT